MTILVFGKSGQVARALAMRGEVVALGRAEIDILDEASIRAALRTHNPRAIINAAAYTAVDKAEDDEAAAFALNRDAPALIARICADMGTPLVHISTDYVFDGAKAAPYAEDDATSPTSVYGASKRAGEAAVLQSGAHAAIIRTSWVYASSGANFVLTMLRLAQDRDEISVVADQFGRPTWANDLAEACLASAAALQRTQSDARGLFHFANAGDASWADLAEAVFAEAESRGWPSARVKRISTAEYPTRARRPANSRLGTAKIEKALAIRPRPWRQALTLCLDERAI